MRRIIVSCCCLLLLSYSVYGGPCKDDFEDGNANGWEEVAGEWKVQDGLYAQIGTNVNLGVPRTIIKSPWDFKDGIIEVTIIFDKKSDGTEIPSILYRMVDKDNGYVFRMNNGILEVGRFTNAQYEYIRGDAFPIDTGKPCVMKLEVEGIFTKVYYNGVIKIRVGEPEAKRGYEKGKVGLAVFDPKRPVYFDNITIEGQGVYAFPPMDQAVELKNKLVSLWGRIKGN